jgi:hypothetical protein
LDEKVDKHLSMLLNHFRFSRVAKYFCPNSNCPLSAGKQYFDLTLSTAARIGAIQV